MLISNRWQSKTALIMALGMTSTAVIPIRFSAPAMANSQPYAIAQNYPRSSRSIVPAGTNIPVRYEKAEKIILSPKEKSKVTLTVARSIRSDGGTVVIPAGSQIEGELQPADGGTQFVAKDLILRRTDERLPIDARSEVITETETITKKTNPDILKGAAIGAAAAAVVSEIFGDIDLREVLGGAGIGALASLVLGGRREKEVEVVVIRPERDLTLTLEEDFVPARSNR